MVALQLLLVAGALGANGETVLLNFTSPHCGHCRTMEPVLGQLEAAGMQVRPIDVEQHPQIAQRFGVQHTPTFVMLVDGRETNRVVGSATAQKLQSLFPVQEALPNGEVRGQSPNDPSGNYLGQRLGGLFGKGQSPSPAGGEARSEGPPSNDPFAQQQSLQQNPREIVPRSPDDPQARAMAAAVRLKIEDAKGHSIGSGTIVDTHGDEAVLITCGHIFRESQGQGRIVVDLFHPQPRTIEGKLLDYDLKRDIAIVSIAPGAGVVSAPVAPQGLSVNKSDAAFSIGCDKGQDPSIRPTKITALNRYQGPPNIEAAGEPVDGRSGGGLFSRDGYLIGVCNAADPADNEGIYAAIATIHWQLEKVGLEKLYQQPSQPQVLAETNPGQDVAGRLADTGRGVPEFPRNSDPRDLMTSMTAGGSPAAQTEVAGGSDTELICIVRSKDNPSAKGQVFVIPRASADLLQQIAASSSDPTAAADIALQADRRNAATPPSRGTAPVVRGQSRQ